MSVGSSGLTFVKDKQMDVGRLPHHIWRILHIAGEGPIIGIFQVVDVDGSVFAPRISDPLDAVFEDARVVYMGFSFGVVEYLMREKNGTHLPKLMFAFLF